MGMVSVLGALIVITGWIALVEFDTYPEAERGEIMQRIKASPALIVLILLLPVGLVLNVLGVMLGLLWLMVLGETLILLQSIIVSLLLWKRKRWKGILLFVIAIVLGFFMYLPLFFI